MRQDRMKKKKLRKKLNAQSIIVYAEDMAWTGAHMFPVHLHWKSGNEAYDIFRYTSTKNKFVKRLQKDSTNPEKYSCDEIKTKNKNQADKECGG